jgi:hypothetical protein
MGRPLKARAHRSRRDDMQIDFIQFLTQAAALAIWVCIAAALYSLGEKFIEGRNQ